MFPNSNIHTHTTFSDGKNTAEEMVLTALKRGFTSLGFSDHGYSPYDVCAMSPEGEIAYRAEIRRLQEKYSGQIELPLGYEHDATMPSTDLSVYDYAIESVHFVHADDVYMSVDESEEALRQHIAERFGGDPYRLTDQYFDNICEALMRTTAEVAGHIDLVTKFNEGGQMFDTDNPRYVRRALEALSIAKERGKIVEVNTGAMSRGYRTEPYPAPSLLRALNDMGGRVLISSDCHRAEWIDYGFDKAAQLVKNAGFKEIWIWKDRAFSAVALQ